MTRPVAIVTGGLRGIGSPARGAGRCGFDISSPTWPRRREELQAASPSSAGSPIAAATSPISTATPPWSTPRSSDFGRIDCLVNNAGIGARRCAATCSTFKPDNFDQVMGVNLRGTVFLTQAVAQGDARGAGRHTDARSSPSPRSAPRWPRPSAPTTASPRPALSMWVKNLALRLAAEQHRRLRGAAGHHPHRHDGGRRRQIRRADRRRAGAGAPLGRGGAMSAPPSRRWPRGTLGFATGSILNVDGALSVPTSVSRW